jgi:type IV pilus assembly protein PilQ
VDFSSEEAGKSTVIIGTTRPVKYKMNKAADKRLQLILFNTNLPDYRKRPLITTRFNSAVDCITPTQTSALKTSSMIVIELRESVPYYIEQVKDLLLVHFDASSIPPRPVEQSDLPSWSWKKVVTQATAGAETIKEKKAEDKVSRPKAARKYTGEKITLDFYDTDIKNVFRILREVSGKNFAIDKDVTGKVTLTLAKPVPWDQALDLILKMNQLGKTSEGNIIRIATLETLKKEEAFKQAEISTAQKARKEQKALEPLVTEYIPVNYSDATEDILPHLEKIISKDRGSAAVNEGDKSTETASGGASVSADKRTNMIIMTDIAEKIEQAREIVKQLDKVTPQVMIEARIVEASDKFSREIGVDWGIDTDIDSASLGGTYGYNAAVNLPIASPAAAIGFNFSRLIGSQFILDATLQASETQGDLKIISSPKILTLDNVEATIMQGLQYPIVTPGTDGGPATTKLEDLLLELTVKPHVTSDNRISMEINIKKKDLGTLINTKQSFTKKEATTKLLVDDSNTVVIGGIIQRTTDMTEAGVPWLSKIPVLGWFFKTEYKKDHKDELLIFITPKIVQFEQQSNNTAYK